MLSLRGQYWIPRGGNAGQPATGNETSEISRSVKQLVVKGRLKVRLPARPSMLESILGGIDGRERILDTELAPWRMICSLEIKSPLGTFLGTGWFAGPKTVVTAGHCVYSGQMGGAPISIKIIPGRNGSDGSYWAPYGSKDSRKFSATDRWLETGGRRL